MSAKTREYAKKLTAQMTLEEKMSQMLYESPAIDRLGIPAYNWWNEALHGVARTGVATMFPQAIAMAATFDEKLLEKAGDVVSTEGRAKFNQFSKRGDRGIYKGLTYWAPNVNIFRDPRWGRGHETYGEDPYLTGKLGCAYIKGLQGPDKEHLKAAACAKHYAVHSGPEALRHEFNAEVSKHDLYDTYLYAFKRCVKDAGVEAVMGAYNRVNGEPACGSKTLLKDILREEFGFEGHVVSDCWAINDFHLHHHVTGIAAESAAMAVNNGCDLNCGNAFLHLPKAYEMGLVTEEAVTEAVERLLDVRIRLGMLEEYPSPYDDIPFDKVECPEHIAVSMEVSGRSLVLLKNAGDFLPLQKEKLNSIAVIGPNANSRAALVGNYEGTSSQYITPLEGIQQYVGEDVKVYYAQGCGLYKDKVEALGERNDRIQEAIATAEQADVVVLCLGLDASIEGEEGDAGNAYASGDKLGLGLPGLQEELLETITAVGKPVIVLLLAGSAIDLSWAEQQKNVKSIVDCWYPGARGGRSIAHLLFGEFSPSGKLPVTFYQGTENLPEFTDYSMAHRTYRYENKNVLYPFGYGLHYGKVVYDEEKVSVGVTDVGQEVTVSATVTNKSAYPLWETVQVYVKRQDAQEFEPGFQLKGIACVPLTAGEKREVEITLTARDFAYITEEGECKVRPGEYVISIGGQQPDERSVELTGQQVVCLKVTKTGEEIPVEY